MKPGFYWVIHSEAYRAAHDKIHMDCHLTTISWETAPFIAEWATQYDSPSEKDWGWFRTADDRMYESVDDLTIIAGPLTPPLIPGVERP